MHLTATFAAAGKGAAEQVLHAQVRARERVLAVLHVLLPLLRALPAADLLPLPRSPPWAVAEKRGWET